MALILRDFGTMLSIVFFLSLISGSLLARLPGKSSGTLLARLPGKSSGTLLAPPSGKFSELLSVPTPPLFSETDNKSGTEHAIADNSKVIVVVVCALFLVGSVLLFVVRRKCCYYCRKARPQTQGDRDSNPGSWVTYSVRDLIVATKNFSDSNLVGQGGFGRVYRADFGGNRIAAVKRLLDPVLFANELSILLKMPRHPNLVNLMGLCSEPDYQLIVFEYVAKGTLFSHLHENQGVGSPLSWAARKKIALQVAEALKHLHEVAKPPIIHRDVKSTNVLLKNDLSAKLADFGIAKLGPKNNRSTGATPHGTFGYMDPQCMRECKLSAKCDVYSFGVLLLELITGSEVLTESGNLVIRTSIDRESKHSNNRMRIVHESLSTDRNNRRELLEMIKIANRCLRREGVNRPSMAEVVNMIQGIGNANGS